MFKYGLLSKGHSFKNIAWISGQLNMIDTLIKEESFYILDELLRKTNYRLLSEIIKGQKNILSIYNNPDTWQLGKLEDNYTEYVNSDSLIFATEKYNLVFSKNRLVNACKYINNKWQ